MSRLLLPCLCLFICAPLCALAERARTLELRHVAIELRFDWAQRQAEGTATLTLAPRTATRRIALDAGRLEIRAVRRAGGAALAFEVDGGARDGGLVILLDREARAGERLRLQIEYRTTHRNESDPNNVWGSTGLGLRFFEPSFTDARKRRQIWSSGDPGSNRHWFPGSEEPGQWHSSELKATVPAPLSVVASGRLVSVKTNADGTRSFHWKAERPHAGQRLGFVVGEFVDVPQRVGALALHNFGYPDETVATRDSVERLPDMVRFFTALTGRALPAPGYSQVFVQDLPWGFAHAGFAVQTENMVDDFGTHADYLYLWDGLQAESLAHQWFGVALGAREARHAWLDRGFAHYLSGLYSEHRIGREEFLLWTLLADQTTVLADWKAGVRQPVVPASLADADAAAFVTGNQPYARGALVLHMLRKELGEARWRQALRSYVRRHAGGPVDSDDFRRAVDAAAGRPMAWFFEQWLQRADHPVFELTQAWDAAARRLRLEVKQVAPAADKTPAPAPFRPFQGHVEIEIDGRTERVWLAPQDVNVFEFASPQAPRLVNFDVEGTWLKELRFVRTPDELLHLLRHSRDALARNAAMVELGTLAKAADTPAATKSAIHAALREAAARPAYWRVRFNAIQQLRGVLAPATLTQPVALDEATTQWLLQLIRDERSWLRTAAIAFLGMTRDPRHAALYESHLRDPSDRVINAAAVALGKSRGSRAFEALTALPPHPSWKSQSLISALAGLKELGDARGGELALQALADQQSPRWTLATPVWDFRVTAAETLAALGQGGRGYPLVRERFERALADGEVNDVFNNLLLLVTLADARGREVFPLLKQHYGGNANAMKAVAQSESDLEARLKAR